jgi:hypothetical protein
VKISKDGIYVESILIKTIRLLSGTKFISINNLLHTTNREIFSMNARSEISKYAKLIEKAKRRLNKNIQKARNLSKNLRKLIKLIKIDIKKNKTFKQRYSKAIRSTQQVRENQKHWS